MQRAIEQLPADYREVLVLRELEGLSYKEIAASSPPDRNGHVAAGARARAAAADMNSVEATDGGTHELS